jgi:hypothetical protein
MLLGGAVAANLRFVHYYAIDEFQLTTLSEPVFALVAHGSPEGGCIERTIEQPTMFDARERVR